jgi:2-dehydropantoate 2-reductase
MRHLDTLDARFGASRVLGGLCLISSVLDSEGRIVHMNDTHVLSFGPRDGLLSARVESISSTLSGARFDARLSDNILHAMWGKWVFIAASVPRLPREMAFRPANLPFSVTATL